MSISLSCSLITAEQISSMIGSPVARARSSSLSVVVAVIFRFGASDRSTISVTTKVSLTRSSNVRRTRATTTHHSLYRFNI